MYIRCKYTQKEEPDLEKVTLKSKLTHSIRQCINYLLCRYRMQSTTLFGTLNGQNLFIMQFLYFLHRNRTATVIAFVKTMYVLHELEFVII